MTSTTDPTVPLPTATNTDDDDDDDDDVTSAPPASQPPAATPPPAQVTSAPAPAPPPAQTTIPGVPGASPNPATTPTSAPGTPSGGSSISQSVGPSSATRLADGIPSGSATALPPPAGSGGDGLSTGASAGIGIGVALIVCLAAFGTWFFLRRRKARRTKTHLTSSRSSDEEHAPQAQKSEVYAYRAGGPAEVSGDEKPRRWSELESPTYVAEVGDGQVYRAELPGSVVPVAGAGKGAGDRLFADAPIDEVDEPVDPQERTIDKKRDDRLFSDPPMMRALILSPVSRHGDQRRRRAEHQSEDVDGCLLCS